MYHVVERKLLACDWFLHVLHTRGSSDSACVSPAAVWWSSSSLWMLLNAGLSNSGSPVIARLEGAYLDCKEWSDPRQHRFQLHNPGQMKALLNSEWLGARLCSCWTAWITICYLLLLFYYCFCYCCCFWDTRSAMVKAALQHTQNRFCASGPSTKPSILPGSADLY